MSDRDVNSGGSAAGPSRHAGATAASEEFRFRRPAQLVTQVGRYLLLVVLALFGPGASSRSAAAPDSLRSSADVIVVGAGISGLTAAALLVDAGYDVVVLEKELRVGGRTIDGRYQGFSYAQGTEYLGSPEGALAEILEELALAPKEIPSPADAHFRDGRLYWGEDGIALMLIERSSRAQYNAFLTRIREAGEDYEEIPDFDLDSELAQLDALTARQWFQAAGFSAIYQEVFNVMARGLFGAGLDEISALSYIPELAYEYEDAEPVTDVDDLENVPLTGEETDAYTFLGGISEVTEALAERLGDHVRLGAEVIEVRDSPGGHLVRFRRDGVEDTAVGRVVLLAVPAPVALTIASEILSNEQKNLLGQIPFASYVTVSLFTSEPVFGRAFDLTVRDGLFFTDLYDSTWVQRYYDPSPADDEVHISGVYVAPTSYQDTSLLALTDEEIVERTFEDLEELEPQIRDLVLDWEVRRFPYAYPVMTPGAYARLTRLHEINQGSALLAGDYMIYPTFEAAADSGDLAGKKAMAYLGTATACVPGDTTLCLSGGRFRVRVSWRDFAGTTGQARRVAFGSDDSGLLWFFDPDNWELLVKVLDGCAVNQKYWVFAAATTNVEYTLEVTDSQSGQMKTYHNPLGTSAAAVTDTFAFATCP
ncbi:MAG: NAD(P)-binding protein [bacterium]|nr:NAD(P)-binding protein [bacterium]